jgi:hypothetical protein
LAPAAVPVGPAADRKRQYRQKLAQAQATLEAARAALQIQQQSVHSAEAGLMSTQAALRATEAARLRSLLGLRAGTPLVITGDLADRARFDRALLMPPAGPRADALAYEAQAREAEAESRAADAMRAPKLVVGLRYEHEEPEVNSVFGLLGITLPFFDYGQGIRAKADARAARARGDAVDAKNRALVEQSGAADTYRVRVGAAEATYVAALAQARIERQRAEGRILALVADPAFRSAEVTIGGLTRFHGPVPQLPSPASTLARHRNETDADPLSAGRCVRVPGRRPPRRTLVQGWVTCSDSVDSSRPRRLRHWRTGLCSRSRARRWWPWVLPSRSRCPRPRA